MQGKVKIQGSKNAALPILAACLMIRETVTLRNVPKISDVHAMLRILEKLGCRVRWGQNALTIDSSDAERVVVDGELAMTMRSSIFLLGALLARRGRLCFGNPGGCVIGKRPIDIHQKALRLMGTEFEEKSGLTWARAERGLRHAEVELDFPSVGATENVVMAATAAEGETRIIGAAKEPEVQALCMFLNAAGAKIRGIGTAELVIDGGFGLHGTEYDVPADRIVAGTYLFSGFAAGGSIFLEDAPAAHMEAVIRVAERMGAGVTLAGDGIYAQFPERAGLLPRLRTDVYPGFPTDLQSVALAIRCTGRGKTLIRETIFENRFRIADDLRSMGAKIRQNDEGSVLVSGVDRLFGRNVEAQELRGGAALVIAALGAEGESLIRGRRYVERGYENLCRDLRDLGARIVSE